MSDNVAFLLPAPDGSPVHWEWRATVLKWPISPLIIRPPSPPQPCLQLLSYAHSSPITEASSLFSEHSKVALPQGLCIWSFLCLNLLPQMSAWLTSSLLANLGLNVPFSISPALTTLCSQSLVFCLIFSLVLITSHAILYYYFFFAPVKYKLRRTEVFVCLFRDMFPKAGILPGSPIIFVEGVNKNTKYRGWY